MWPFKRKPLCALHRGLAPLTHSEVYFEVCRTLEEASLATEAAEYAVEYEELMFGTETTQEDFAEAAKRLALRYVRVKVV